MHIVLLSGGSGKRLWPLSNENRSKQFLKLLTDDCGNRESMVQRVVRQIKGSTLSNNLIIVTSANQREVLESQLGKEVEIITEPERRNTFPAIALASSYLKRVKALSDEEIVVVMPCDQYVDMQYFETIAKMVESAKKNEGEMILMGICPTKPSEKFGYILPKRENSRLVGAFIEKPNSDRAKRLIEDGAYWNGGVFAFKLGFAIKILEQYLKSSTHDEFIANFSELPKNSFDYEILERADSLVVEKFNGLWADLGTWDAFVKEIKKEQIGNVILNNCENTVAINELNIPLVCNNIRDLIIAVSPDGLLVTDREKCDNVKDALINVINRPMYEEKRWGEYRVVDSTTLPDGFSVVTKLMTLTAGCSTSFHRHHNRSESWTFISGEGELNLDGSIRKISRGDVVLIPQNKAHALRAISLLTFIEVQTGEIIAESDTERLPLNWD